MTDSREGDSVHVECYAGYRGEERPLRFKLGNHSYEIEGIEDRWYSPGATYFRVVAGGDLYILRHDENQDFWTLEGYRRATKPGV